MFKKLVDIKCECCFLDWKSDRTSDMGSFGRQVYLNGKILNLKYKTQLSSFS